MLEVLKMQANQQRALLSSLENGQPLSVLKMQQLEFEKLRNEHTVRLPSSLLLPPPYPHPLQSVFHELSEEIRKLPLMENEYQHPQHNNTTNHLLESNISFDYDGTNSFRAANSNDFLLHTGSSSTGTASSLNHHRFGGTGSSTESHNGLMNTLQSVPESPIRRSASPTRFRENSSPTNVPFIPRSSTHRHLPSTSPYRRSNEMNSSSSIVNTDQLGEIIKDAISSAVEAAQTQWIKELKSGTFTHPDYAGSDNFHHRFLQLSSKVDILQDQVSPLPRPIRSSFSTPSIFSFLSLCLSPTHSLSLCLSLSLFSLLSGSRP
jgi:hypothetical protein